MPVARTATRTVSVDSEDELWGSLDSETSVTSDELTELFGNVSLQGESS